MITSRSSWWTTAATTTRRRSPGRTAPGSWSSRAAGSVTPGRPGSTPLAASSWSPPTPTPPIRRTGCGGSTPDCGRGRTRWRSADPAAMRIRPGGAGCSRRSASPWWPRRPGLRGRPSHLTATNVAFRREGFPGYDTRLTQGGDEVDLLRRLVAWGPVLWDADNEVVTSARRFRRGLLHTLVISYGYYYALSSVVNRIAGRRVIGVAPAVRSDPSPHHPTLARQRHATHLRRAVSPTAVSPTAARMPA